MTRARPAQRAELSANQERKQQQIIAAAREVLVQHGIAGCTERQVATAAGIAKNAVHYYFADMPVLIDRAMAAHVDDFLAGLRTALDDAPPGGAVDALTAEYLTAFRTQPHAALLWFEFWNYCARTDRLAVLADIEERMVALLAAALRQDAGSGRDVSPDAAPDVYVLLLGSVVDQVTNDTGVASATHRVTTLIAGRTMTTDAAR